MIDLVTIILSCMVRFKIIFCHTLTLPYPSISAIHQYSNNIIISYQITFSDLKKQSKYRRNFQKKSGNVTVKYIVIMLFIFQFFFVHLFIHFFTFCFLVLESSISFRILYGVACGWRQGTSFVRLPVNPTTASIYITVCFVSMTVSQSKSQTSTTT